MSNEMTSRSDAFLSANPAGRRQLRFALAAVLVSMASFLAVVPSATRPVAPIPAFIPAYESALAICFLITAVLLFGQYNFSRSRPLLVLASGYLFTACIAVTHMLTFPGVFSSTGLLGAGSQTSVWLYVFWHAGFPVFVIGYAWLEGRTRAALESRRAHSSAAGHAGFALLLAVAITLALVAALGSMAIVAHASLPSLLVDNQPTPLLATVGVGFWALSLLALLALWRRRPSTILDLWLMVVMCAWFFEVALFVVFNTARFDLGWYAARIYGLFAASSLLIVLLRETGTQSARLAELTEELSEANQALEKQSLHDALTTLANRRFFDAYLVSQCAIARRYGRTLALVMCDADAFKAYNDANGHPAGDECLKQIAAALQSACHRPADMVARYGGEEFAMVLPDTALADAIRIAETARGAVERLRITRPDSTPDREISISCGVAILDRDMSAELLVRAADQKLFEAKRQGRNRVVS